MQYQNKYLKLIRLNESYIDCDSLPNAVYCIVCATFRYYAQESAKGRVCPWWKDVTAQEIRAYFGLHILMGLNRRSSYADYWSTDPQLGKHVQTTITIGR